MSDETPKGKGKAGLDVGRLVHEMRSCFMDAYARLHEAHDAVGGGDSMDPLREFELAEEYLRCQQLVDKHAGRVTFRLKREALRRLKFKSGTVAFKELGVDSHHRLRVTVPEHAYREGEMPELDQVSIALDTSTWVGIDG